MFSLFEHDVFLLLILSFFPREFDHFLKFSLFLRRGDLFVRTTEVNIFLAEFCAYLVLLPLICKERSLLLPKNLLIDLLFEFRLEPLIYNSSSPLYYLI